MVLICDFVGLLTIPRKTSENSGNCQEGLPWQGLEEYVDVSDYQEGEG
jgi:hypothetical protein